MKDTVEIRACDTDMYLDALMCMLIHKCLLRGANAHAHTWMFTRGANLFEWLVCLLSMSLNWLWSLDFSWSI